MHNILLRHLPHGKERNFPHIYKDDCSQKHFGVMPGLEGFPLFLHVVFTSRPPLAYINKPKATVHGECYHYPLQLPRTQLEGNTEKHA
jgi:hypothetical protein